MNSTEFNQSDHCLYFSCVERSVSPALHISLYVIAAVVILLTMCGNLLVIISVSHFKQLHTPTNMLVLSLALSDFLIGAFVMPPMFIWSIESCWIFGSGFCSCFWITSGVIILISLYQIASISVDRYFALSSPFLYMNKVSVKMMQVVILLEWSVSMGYNCILFYFNASLVASLNCPGECFLFTSKIWGVVDLVITFVFPCSVIITFYSLVFVIAVKHANAIRELSNLTQAKTHTDSMKSERKAAKTLGIVVSVFLICLLPYFIFHLLGGFDMETLILFYLVSVVFCLNSTINPFIYALFYPWFRKCVKIIITRQIFQTDSSLMNVL